MIIRHITHAVRNLKRNKTFAFINVLGLSLGLTAFILIMLYVRFELSFDRFHEHANNIYRVATKVTLQNEVIAHESSAYGGIVKSLKEDYAEVDDVTVLYGFDSESTLIRIQQPDESMLPVTAYRGLYADNAFFRVFSFPLITGDAAFAPYSAVISEAFLRKHFQKDPIGKVIQFTDDSAEPKLLTVTGVMKDVPDDSHLKFDIVINLPNELENFWDFSGHAYARLKPDTDVRVIEGRLNALARRNNGLKPNRDDFGQVSTFTLQPLASIHLHSDLADELEEGGNATLVYALVLLAVMIAIVAWVNYVNLSTAIYSGQMQQIAIRKIIGASKRNLMLQILMESAVLNGLALILALIFSQILSSTFARQIGINEKVLTLTDPHVWWVMLIFAIISIVASGSYPAAVIASFKPIDAMKTGFVPSKKFHLRKVLLVFQFIVATALIITTLAAYRQLRFMKDHELGINIEQVLVVRALNFNHETWSDSAGGFVIDHRYLQTAQQFSDQIRQLPEVLNTASLSHLPGKLPNWGTEFKADDVNPSNAVNLKAIGIDYDLIPTLGITLLAGRNFSRDFTTDRGSEYKRAVIVNETAADLLGFKNPQDAISKHISTYWGADYEIIGVVQSFHQVSLKEELTPLYFILQPRALSYFAIDLQTHDVGRAIADIRSVWAKAFPEHPFDYFFLDDYFNRQYHSEARFTWITSIFTILAISIGCMGLFGLTSHAIVQRTKEIGIRKVLGASVTNVIGLFSIGFGKLILVANCIAIAISYIGISMSLDNYAYRTPLLWWMFAVPAIATACIAFTTVTLQTLKIAAANPVDSLKNDG